MPWTWACLPCNATGIGSPAAHRCAGTDGWRREFWRTRLLWARLSIGAVDALLASPVPRAELVRLLGDRWRPEHTSPMTSHASARGQEAA